jgi:putative hemin transport protein
MTVMSPEQIRAARAKRPRLYARDFAQDIGITEAELCAAFTGISATRISANPDAIMPCLSALGQVMALTRNDSCVIEKVGQYDHYQPGPEAAQVLNPPIELRLFSGHWVHAFALDEPGPKGPKRSIQIFDAAGEAVHKIHLRPETNAEAWGPIVAALRLENQSQQIDLGPNPAQDPVIDGWARLNHLEDHRNGVSAARRLAQGAVEQLMVRAAETAVPSMFTVGNAGCIGVHAGPIVRVLEAGPWINVLDPGLELHLRMDHLAEVWAAGDGSVHAFDADGRLIVQLSGVAQAGEDAQKNWAALVAELPGFKAE